MRAQAGMRNRVAQAGRHEEQSAGKDDDDDRSELDQCTNNVSGSK